MCGCREQQLRGDGSVLVLLPSGDRDGRSSHGEAVPYLRQFRCSRP